MKKKLNLVKLSENELKEVKAGATGGSCYAPCVCYDDGCCLWKQNGLEYKCQAQA